MNSNLRKFFLVTLTILSLINNTVRAVDESIDDITWMTENYPPYNYPDNKEIPMGISVSVVSSLLKKANSMKTIENIQILPWAIAYQELEKNQNYALFSTARTAEREKNFKWVGPLTSSKIVVFSRKASSIKIASLDELKKYKVSAVTSDVGQEIVNKAVPDLKMELVSNLEQGVEKLNAGNIDLLVGDENVLRYLLAKHELDDSGFEAVYDLKDVDYWIALNSSTSDALIKSIQTAFDGMDK